MGHPDQLLQEQQEYQYDQPGVDAPPYEHYMDQNQPSEIAINYNVSDQTESETYVVDQDQYAPQQEQQTDPAQYVPPQQDPQGNPTQYPPPQQNQQQNPVQYPPPQQSQQQNPVQYPPHQQSQQQTPVQFPPRQNPPVGRPITPSPSHPPPGSPMQYPPTRSTQPTQFPPPPSQAAHQPNQPNYQQPQAQYPPPQYAPPPVPQSPQMGAYGSTMPQSPYKPAPGIPMANQFPNPVAQVGTQPWRTGLFDCLEDPQNAVLTACFPCLTFGQIAEIIDNGHTTCASSGIMYGCIAFLIGCPCILSCGYRTKLRSRFRLLETPAPDWVVHCLCEWCALCQAYRELNLRGLDPSIGWQGNLAKNNMMQQQQMAMMPPTNQTMNY